MTRGMVCRGNRSLVPLGAGVVAAAEVNVVNLVTPVIVIINGLVVSLRVKTDFNIRAIITVITMTMTTLMLVIIHVIQVIIQVVVAVV